MSISISTTFVIGFRKPAELISGHVGGQVVADIVPLCLEVTRPRRLGLAPRPELAARMMLARLLTRVPRGLRVLVAQPFVVAEVGRVVLEAGAVGSVRSVGTLKRFNLSSVCFTLIWK